MTQDEERGDEGHDEREDDDGDLQAVSQCLSPAD